MRVLKWFFSGEVLFSGYLVGYVLTSAFPKMPNFTYIFLLLSFLVANYRLFKDQNISKKSLVPIAIYISLFILFAISLFYTPSNVYSKDKIINFATLTAWSFFGVFILIKNEISIKRFLEGIVFFSLATAILMIGESTLNSYTRAGIGGNNNVISVGRICGLGLITTIGMLIYSGRNYKKTFSIVAVMLLIIALLLTGSRGPLIAVIISLICFIPISFNFSFKKMSLTFNKGIISLVIITALITACLIPFANAGTFETMQNRMNVLVQEDGGGSSVIGRTSRIDVAIDMFVENPILGKGIGSFPIFYGGLDNKDYPHNIFIELLSEFGLIGFSLFIFLIIYAVFGFIKYRRTINEYQIIIIIVFIYLMVNASISGDINTNRLLFTALALSYMLPLYRDSDS